MAATIPRVLVYGGKGALGSVVVSHFKARNWVSAAAPAVWGCVHAVAEVQGSI